MKRVLIDDGITIESGNKAETYIEYYDQPSQVNISDPDVLVMELAYAPIEGIMGYRLVEEEILPDGSRRTSQEFILGPHIAYALFKHWEGLDRECQDDED